MKGRFNGFQRAMLQWCSLHPYSAIHIVRLPGGCDATAWEERLRRVIEHHGLAMLELDPRRGRFHYHGVPPPDPLLRVLPAADDPAQALVAEVERQLNDPFPFERKFTPVRFFALPEDGGTVLGLVYFHPIADAESISLLLLEAAAACTGEAGGGAGAAPPDLYRPVSRIPHGFCGALHRALAVSGRWQALRHADRPPCRDPADFTNRFTVIEPGPEVLGALVATARAWEVTVNDLLLAMLLRAVEPLAPRRLTARRRRKLAVGCVVNLRRDLRGADSRSRFGLFLGSFTVTHEVPPGIPLSDLARAVRQQTLVIKRHKHYLGSPLEFAAARIALRMMNPARQRKFHRKNYPLWGGITNMKLDGLLAPGTPAPSSYLRAVSTGPATPLVLSVTSLGTRMTIGVSYRPAMIDDAALATITACLNSQFAENLPPP